MTFIKRLRTIARRTLMLRIPSVGDAVWWAPKEEKCVVSKVELDGSLIFQGGPLVKRPSGKVTPRWTVATAADACRWHEGLGAWIVGEGPVPKKPGEIVVQPSPVNTSVGTQKGRLL